MKPMSKKQWRKLVVRTIMRKLKKVRIEQVCPYTCVVMQIGINDKKVRLVGFSKVMWPDVWNSNTGVEMAVKRAVHRLARQLVDGKRPGYEFLSYEWYRKKLIPSNVGVPYA